MEIGFDHDAWPLGQGPGAESGAVHGRFGAQGQLGVQGPLDWHGLRSRFLAARACHEVLGSGENRSNKVIDASFDRSAARALADFEDASHGVNLENSVDGKAPFGIGEDVAAASVRGDRG
jgi:hypothetical protein